METGKDKMETGATKIAAGNEKMETGGAKAASAGAKMESVRADSTLRRGDRPRKLRVAHLHALQSSHGVREIPIDKRVDRGILIPGTPSAA